MLFCLYGTIWFDDRCVQEVAPSFNQSEKAQIRFCCDSVNGLDSICRRRALYEGISQWYLAMIWPLGLNVGLSSRDTDNVTGPFLNPLTH